MRLGQITERGAQSQRSHAAEQSGPGENTTMPLILGGNELGGENCVSKLIDYNTYPFQRRSLRAIIRSTDGEAPINHSQFDLLAMPGFLDINRMRIM